MKRITFAFLTSLLILTSCGPIVLKKELDAANEVNDSLRIMQAAVEQEMNMYLKAINEIQTTMEEIKQKEQILTMKKADEDLTASDMQLINEDLKSLGKMLEDNRNELQKLKNQAQKSTFHIKELQKTIKMLTERLDEESKKVLSLTEELEAKNILLSEISEQLQTKEENIRQLEDKTNQQQQQLEQQETVLNSAWYAFGSKKELREQGILNRRGTFSQQRVLENDFNKDYFVKIDVRQTTEIPLYSSKAKILTTHPTSAYTLERKGKEYVLVIVDYKEFWSVSRYLVVEVD